MIREITPDLASHNPQMLIAKALTEQFATEMAKLHFDVKSIKMEDRRSYADISFKEPNKDQREIDAFFRAMKGYKVGESKPDANGYRQGVFPSMDQTPFAEENNEDADEDEETDE